MNEQVIKLIDSSKETLDIALAVESERMVRELEPESEELAKELFDSQGVPDRKHVDRHFAIEVAKTEALLAIAIALGRIEHYGVMISRGDV
jgi:hypothetical protein